MHTVKNAFFQNTISLILMTALTVLLSACDTNAVVMPSDIDKFSSALSENTSGSDAAPIQTIAALPEETAADPQTTIAPKTSVFAHETTTIAPETTTVTPEATAITPEITTAALKTTTAAPVTTTIAPVTTSEPISVTYVLNKNTKKFHNPTCKSVKQIKESNKGSFTGTRDDVMAMGYKPCGNCHP